jgi:hypothetical protein
MANAGLDSSVITYVVDYNLQTYVPIPKTGEIPITLVNSRVELDATVVWMDQAETELPALGSFQDHTVYKAKIQLTAKPGYAFNPDIAFAYPPGKITTQNGDLGDSTRTIMVTYNDSHYADITFVTDYNLQTYVPVPISGESPVRAVNTREDMTIEVIWKVEDPPGSDSFNTPINTADFQLGTRYKAEITLTTKTNYQFREGDNFTYTDGSQTIPIGSATDPGERQFEVFYAPTRAPIMIYDYNLTPYITKPVGGATPVMSFAASQYTGRVSWRNAVTQEVLAGPFQYGTAYIADLILTANSGYIIDGIGQNVFIHTGAETSANPQGSGVITMGFAPTSNAPSPIVVYDTILTSRIPKPVSRATPVTSFTATQYTGTVIWKNTITQTVLIGSFEFGTSYTAVITLSAASGYTFTGIGYMAFSHGDAPGAVTNSADSGVVTINFPPAGPSTQQAMSFGPVGTEGSALKLMKDRKDDNNPVTIELPGNVTETVIPNSVVLQVDYNSPANITIDGHQRVLKINDPGIMITVNNGITLTLLNITLEGMNANNSPLVRVRPGGKLILGNGAVITGNEGTGAAGGIWVNGGELTMNQGSIIKKMKTTPATVDYADMGGGVLVDANGKFTMTGGTIGGTNTSDGNIFSSPSSGGGAGGVYINGGSFDMYSGTIESNSSAALFMSAGGVLLATGGIFNMHGGTIRGNAVRSTFSGSNCAGGVLITGGSYSGQVGFTIYNADAVIEHNVAETESSAGGVLAAEFLMINGTIRNNIAQGPLSGGGVLITSSFIMNNGTIQNNEARGFNSGGGVYAKASDQQAGFIMYGGSIKGNRSISTGNPSGGDQFSDEGQSGGGIYASHFTMNGGTIGGDLLGDANTAVFGANGVYVPRLGKFTMTNGTIKGNVGPHNNYGVYVPYYTFTPNQGPVVTKISTFEMSEQARVDGNNPVFLESNAMITIVGNLTVSPAANIIHPAPENGITRLLKAATAALIQNNAASFYYNGTSGHINDSPEESEGAFYGKYQG